MKKIIISFILFLFSLLLFNCRLPTANAQSYYDITFENLNDVNSIGLGEWQERIIPIQFSNTVETVDDVVFDYTINEIRFQFGYIVVNEHLWLNLPQYAVVGYTFSSGSTGEVVRFTTFRDINITGDLIDLGPITWYQQYNFTPYELFSFLESKILTWRFELNFNTEYIDWYLALTIGGQTREYYTTTFIPDDFGIVSLNLQGHTEEMPHTEYLYQRWYHYETEYVPPVPELTGFSEWIVNGVGAFLDFEIVPGISITNILLFCLALGLMFVFLRFFMGG